MVYAKASFRGLGLGAVDLIIKQRQRIDDFFAPLDAHQRSTMGCVLETWRRGGGSIAAVGKSLALYTEWEDRQLTVLYAYGIGGKYHVPRLDIPLAVLARNGVPTELLDDWRDDLTTISKDEAKIKTANITISLSHKFGESQAKTLVESALNLTRRI